MYNDKDIKTFVQFIEKELNYHIPSSIHWTLDITLRKEMVVVVFLIPEQTVQSHTWKLEIPVHKYGFYFYKNQYPDMDIRLIIIDTILRHLEIDGQLQIWYLADEYSLLVNGEAS